MASSGTPPWVHLRRALCLGCSSGCLSHDPVCLLCSVGMGKRKKVLWIEQIALGWAGQGASGEGQASGRVLSARVKRGFAGDKVYKVTKDGKQVEVLESEYKSEMNGTETGERRGGKLREATERFAFDWEEAPVSMEDALARILDLNDEKGREMQKGHATQAHGCPGMRLCCNRQPGRARVRGACPTQR